MPTNRRTRRVQRRGGCLANYDRAELAALIQTGRGFLARELDNPDLLVHAWEHYGQTFIPEFIAEWPGCRPLAWWHLAAPEPWPEIDRQFQEFDREHHYPLADRAAVVWRRFQLHYLREHNLMDETEAAAAAEREAVDLDFLRRHFAESFT